MPDLPVLLAELESRKKQISKKLSRILESYQDPFPFDKTNKARNLLELIKKAKAVSVPQTTPRLRPHLFVFSSFSLCTMYKLSEIRS